MQLVDYLLAVVFPLLFQCGMTALHHAALAGVTAIVRVLLKWGGKVDIGDKSGKSPLWYAVDNGDLHCVGALLDNKANPNDTR